MDRRIVLTAGLIGVAVAMGASPAFAHSYGAHGGGFGAGLAHPLIGLDHILAMIAVGVWAAQTGGRALWFVPATFIVVMIGGGALGLTGIALPAVELGILASVVLLGGLIALRARMPLPLGMTVVAFFAVFHGHAHGLEAPAAASPLLYVAGFALATTALHGLGIGLAAAAERLASAHAVRLAGGAVAAAGLALVAGA